VLATDAGMAEQILAGPYSLYTAAVLEFLGAQSRKVGAVAVVIALGDSIYRADPVAGRIDVLAEPPTAVERLRRSGMSVSITGGAMTGVGLGLLLATGLGTPPHPVDPAYTARWRLNQLGSVFSFVGIGLVGIGVPVAVATNRLIRRSRVETRLALIPEPDGGFQLLVYGSLP